MRIGGLAAPLAGVVLAGALLTTTRGLDLVAQPGQLGPGFWPRLVLVGFGLTCLTRLVAVLRAPVAPAIDAPVREAVDWRRLALAIALLALYVIVTPVLGFALATLGFVGAFMRLAGARSVATTVATAVLTTVAVLYVFVKLVYLPFPKGDGPAEAVTIGLYRALGIF